MTIRTFRDIIAWQRAHKLALTVYVITENFPKTEFFGLVSQMRRCAVSVPSNIAEGFARQTKKESLRFYNIAEGSLEELKYQILLAYELKYISYIDYESVSVLTEESGKLIRGWKKAQSL